MSTLEGKVAIITGASNGIGAAAARLFTERGAKVVLADIIDDKGEALADEIGDSAIFSHLDVRSEEDWQRAVDAALANFGKLNVLFNNAGVPGLQRLQEMTLDDYMATVDVNQIGVFLGIKAVIEPMRAAGGGSIINTSSLMGITGLANGMSYCASKFAVTGMTKVAAIELGPYKIRANSIHPGACYTNMLSNSGLAADDADNQFAGTPAGRVGQPRELAAMAAYLASDDSSYSTGAEFLVDGGLNAGPPLDQSDKPDSTIDVQVK
jgi:3alpha(or 20beta)-hydroxysteroid dehydrogenase